MQQHGAVPTTDELMQDARITPGHMRRIRSGSVLVVLVLQNDRILAYRDDETKPFGMLRFGGPYSGAIWIGESLVGEYGQDINGQIVVVDVDAGFLQPGSRRVKDPIEVLTTHAGGS